MILWVLAFLFLLLALHELIPMAISKTRGIRGGWRNDLTLHRQVGLILSRMRESLESGQLIQDSDWERARHIPEPWSWVYGLLQDLRKQGVSIVPTLRRLEELAHQSYQDGLSSRSKSAQGIGQTIISMILIPVLAVLLYQLLPELEAERAIWWCGVSGCVLVAGFGALWMKRLTEDAQYLGLKKCDRSSLFLAKASIERLLAGLASGLPSDLSWSKMVEMWGESGVLIRFWGKSLWVDAGGNFLSKNESAAAPILSRFGTDLRKGIQIGLMEGRPVTEKIENLAISFRAELRGEIDRRIQLLGNQLLMPLFLCVAPAAFGVLGLGLYLGFGSAF
ncbi:MAG: hypothetical protein KA715_06655 [Xanthomonadaceae bacterium]|nr:hypothetical protein [Xanthomonadaceae bacterium]